MELKKHQTFAPMLLEVDVKRLQVIFYAKKTI